MMFVVGVLLAGRRQAAGQSAGAHAQVCARERRGSLTTGSAIIADDEYAEYRDGSPCNP